MHRLKPEWQPQRGALEPEGANAGIETITRHDRAIMHFRRPMEEFAMELPNQRGVVLSALLCGLLGMPASGSIITYDFADLPGGTPASQVTRTFTNGSTELTVSALGQDEDALPNPTETEAVSFAAGKGLGVRDITDLLVSDIDAIDGNRGNEELVFTFNQDVLFREIVFADSNNQDFDGEVFFLLNEGDFGDFQTSGKNIAFFNGLANGGAGNGNSQNLPSYVFPDSKAGPKSIIKVYVQDANSGIYVSSLTVEEVFVPEPCSLLLLGAGAVIIVHRRRAPA